MVLQPKAFYTVNFVGSILPRRDLPDRKAYCRAMLTFFAPGGWQTRLDLCSHNESWESVFDGIAFTDAHQSVMHNMHVLYECRDAQDDYAAQRRTEGKRKFMALFMDDDDIDELD